MSILIFSIIFVPLSLILASWIAARGDRSFLLASVIGSWLMLGFLVAFVNTWMPFSGGGDDKNYYYLADPPISSLADALDLGRFAGLMEQPGYPWLLSLLNALTGHDLLVYKLVNLFFLILLALTWYRIGLALESARFARFMMVGVLCLTPLWYYCFFLLKDMTITLLQSFFVLTVVHIWSAPRIPSIVGASIFSLALLIFRTPLLVQNAAVLLGSLTSKALALGVRGRRLAPLLVAVLTVVAAIPVVTNPEIMVLFGIYTEHRVIGSASMFESSVFSGASTEINRSLFPFIYLFSETAGLNPLAWETLDSSWLRGALALPWIFLVVPFLFLGIRWLLCVPYGVQPAKGLVARLRQSRVITTPWSAIAFFVLGSFGISWMVGDTTRWRIPDMPFIVAIAMAGWYYTSPRLRRQILVLWICGAGMLFALFYMFRV